jgi:hypothetical protein
MSLIGLTLAASRAEWRDAREAKVPFLHGSSRSGGRAISGVKVAGFQSLEAVAKAPQAT